MARVFTRGNQTYLLKEGPSIGTFPFTMFCWVYPLQTNLTCHAMVFNLNNQQEVYTRMGVVSNGTVFFNTRNGGAEPSIQGGSYSTNTWHTLGFTLTSSTSREGYLDGSSVGVNSTSVGNYTPNRYTIGALKRASLDSNIMNGHIFWAAIWNAALTDAEHLALSNGICPLLVRPDSLASFVPLGGFNGQNDYDHIAGWSFTPTNSPTWSDGSPTGLIYPSQQIIGVSQGIITPAVQHARLRIGV